MWGSLGTVLSKDLIVLVIAPLLLTLTLTLLVALLVLLSGGLSQQSSMRNRYEAGNPPWGDARRAVEMQYLPYLVLFATMEPILVIAGFIALAREPGLATVLLASMLALAAPILAYGVEEARRLSWGRPGS